MQKAYDESQDIMEYVHTIELYWIAPFLIISFFWILLLAHYSLSFCFIIKKQKEKRLNSSRHYAVATSEPEREKILKVYNEDDKTNMFEFGSASDFGLSHLNNYSYILWQFIHSHSYFWGLRYIFRNFCINLIKFDESSFISFDELLTSEVLLV